MARIGAGSRAYLLTAFSGTPDGTPPWVADMEFGDDPGYFGEGSAVWAVHGGRPVLVAGIRALIMQTLHPGAMAGVHDWSRYREDPLGRLAGTVRWVLTTSFDDRAGADASSAMVRTMHSRVAGTYVDASGARVPYAAGDPDLLRWVHVVFADSFLRAQQQLGGSIPGGADQYLAEWATAGQLMGVDDPPRSEAELRAQLAAFGPTLIADDRVKEALRFIRNPPLKRSIMPGYHVLFAGAVASLDPEYRRMLGLARPWWPARTATRIVLFFLGLLLGRPSSSEVYARKRLARLAAATTAE
ncbi:oxygenase MpaB family protein [Glaciihabitans sp. dw_435]|uniref:oxygenase MpaB family protein n=1 Tax=Glaciihabitans sp. dw_435 TaxID=2720081 RepID=UPI001BD50DF6|nr:oxygenase MpaB family protein [Glaciihabitans sp. dw_435]